ncbi:MAG TPA: hypothetical protein VLE50_03820, partial [Cellvibrio sp.]|nr:hypothetical protein [Cellvibrio sp.]
VQVGDEARTKLAAINTQGQLLPWNPEISGSTVRTMIVHKESIYVGGYFSHAAGEKRNKLAAFDKLGHVLPWKPPTSDSGVSAIAAGEEAIYAGGGFTMIGGGYRTGMAALDINGRLLPWRPEISGTVFGGNPSIKSLLIENDTLYAGGHFLKAGDETRNHLAAFDKRGKLLPWNPQLDFVAMVNKLYRADDIIYVVGGLLWADSRASYGLEAFDTEGQLQTWAPVISDEVKAILIDSGVMYANKQFFQDGILTGSFESPENFYLETLALEGDVIYAGGQFVHVGHQGRAGLAAFSLYGNVLSWAPQLSGTVQFAAPGVYTLATNMNLIYVGGSFTSANGEIRGHIASFDPEGNLTPWHTSVDYPVNILTIHDGVVYAGGGFTKAGDQTRRGLATFDLLGNLLNK